MSYSLTVTRSASKQYQRLQQSVRDRVDSVILSLKETPRPAGVKKLKDTISDYRVRVGDYRIIYEIDDDARQIVVRRISHRRDAYR